MRTILHKLFLISALFGIAGPGLAADSSLSPDYQGRGASAFASPDFNKTLGGDCPDKGPLRVTDLWSRDYDRRQVPMPLPDIVTKSIGAFPDCLQLGRADCLNGWSYHQNISELKALWELQREALDLHCNNLEMAGGTGAGAAPDFEFGHRVLCADQAAIQDEGFRQNRSKLTATAVGMKIAGKDHDFVLIEKGSGYGGACSESYLAVSKEKDSYHIFNPKAVEESAFHITKKSADRSGMLSLFIPFADPADPNTAAKLSGQDTNNNLFVMTKNGPVAIAKSGSYNRYSYGSGVSIPITVQKDIQNVDPVQTMDNGKKLRNGICLVFYPVEPPTDVASADLTSSTRNSLLRGHEAACFATDWGYDNYHITDDETCLGASYVREIDPAISRVKPEIVRTVPVPKNDGGTPNEINQLNAATCVCPADGKTANIVCYSDPEKRDRVYLMDCRDGLKEGVPSKLYQAASFDCHRYSITIDGQNIDCCVPPGGAYSGTPTGYACEQLVRNYNSYFDSHGDLKKSSGSVDTGKTGIVHFSVQKK